MSEKFTIPEVVQLGGETWLFGDSFGIIKRFTRLQYEETGPCMEMLDFNWVCREPGSKPGAGDWHMTHTPVRPADHAARCRVVLDALELLRMAYGEPGEYYGPAQKMYDDTQVVSRVLKDHDAEGNEVERGITEWKAQLRFLLEFRRFNDELLAYRGWKSPAQMEAFHKEELRHRMMQYVLGPYRRIAVALRAYIHREIAYRSPQDRPLDPRITELLDELGEALYWQSKPKEEKNEPGRAHEGGAGDVGPVRQDL
jgi:hypothetical protein